MKHVHLFEFKNEASVYIFFHFSANENMAKNLYKIAKNEEFISVWQHETCLWDVGAKVYKDRNEKAKSTLLD